MKELCVEVKHLESYDIDVYTYLTTAQIQQIAEAVVRSDNWAERKMNLDMLMLYHATNLTKEEAEAVDYDEAQKAGLFDAIARSCESYRVVLDAIDYMESTQRALAQIIKILPKYIGPLQKVLDKNGYEVKK